MTAGFRVFKKVERPTAELLARFEGLPVANIGDEMHRTASMNARIRPFNRVPLLGPAFTVRVPPGDNLMLHYAIDLAERGDIIVIDGRGDLSQALIGELMALWAARRGIGGIVVDGAIRDSEVLATLDIPVYAAGVQPNGPYKNGPGEVNAPIACGGIAVHPGDILIGDADGVVVVPRADAAEVAERAQAKMRQETAAKQAIAAGTWDRSAYGEKALAAMGCHIVDEHCP